MLARFSLQDALRNANRQWIGLEMCAKTFPNSNRFSKGTLPGEKHQPLVYITIS